MKKLQINWLSVNSITFDYSFWVEVVQTFHNMFTGSNGVIVLSKSSIVRCDVYLFVQDTAIFFRRSVAALFQNTFVETFTAKFRFIRGEVIATVCPSAKPLHLGTSEQL